MAVTGTVFINLPLVEAQTQPPESTNRIFHLGDSGGSIEYPLGWFPQHYANVHELWKMPPEKLANLQPSERETVARIETNVIPCTDHAEAVRRLRRIEAEWGMTSKFLTIGGWPALQRRQLIPKPHASVSARIDSGSELLFMVTTAVAAEKTLVRLDGFAPETASPEVLDDIERIGRALRPEAVGDPETTANEVEGLRNSPSLRMPLGPLSKSALRSPETAVVQPRAAAAASSTVTPGVAVNLGVANLQIGSESEIAVSTNGTNIVVAQQCSFRNSTDGGSTFPNSGGNPGACTGGDSSVAFGLSGDFYWATIGSNNADCPATAQNCNNIQEMARSTNNGVSFANLATIIDCRVTAGCGFGSVPDQEHIAADRFNPSGSGGDQLYLVFRKGFGYGIACSTDSGANWTAVAFHTGGSIDFPRVTVSQNGTVFVVTNNGNNINLDSFNSCQNGLVQNLNQVAIATGINPVACPVPGLDRCNNGNTLSSHTVAVDDTNANHLYAAYAVNTIAPAPLPPGPSPTPLTTLGNENVLLQDSIDGGATWRPAVQISQAVNGRRFEPWVCSTSGIAFAPWYDRRAATTTANDLTDYRGGSAKLDGAGNLQVAATDFQIDGAADPECASGWPCSTRNPFDAQSCSTQPQLAGRCRHTPNNNTDSFTSCDFTAPACPSTESCQPIGNGGCPKYGDYTGSACLLGRFYTVWASATNQPGATSTAGNISSFFVETVVSATPTTSTYTGPTGGDYHDSVTLSGTLRLSGTSIGVPGQTLTLSVGSQNCSTGATNASGAASCSLTLNQIPGTYTAKASFAGTSLYQASSSASTTFIITKEETTLSYTGPTVVANGSPVTLSGVLLEDGILAIQGRTVVFTLGSGATAQTCSGTTDATGKAVCTITRVNQPLGSSTVADSFLGDAFYLPSSNSARTILFAFLTRGAFVVGDKTAAGAVEFWGDNWATVNVLTGGPAPHAFKGFAANTSEPPACGSTWVTASGNSSRPPAGPLPAFMGVVVSSRVSKSGSTISGNVLKVVVVTPNQGYEPNPGHHGTGTVVATFCQ